MAKRPPPYRLYAREGVAWIDIRSIPGFPRVREALGVPYGDWARRRPTRGATEAATARYAELISGRTVAESDRVLTAATDEELVALWLAGTETPKNRKSIQTKKTYGRTWHAFFCDEALLGPEDRRWKDARTPIERMVDDAGVADLAQHRLTKVLKKTVRKEFVALFEFFRWAKEHRHIAVLPTRPVLPRKETGVRAGPQRESPVDIEPEEARSLIDALPEWSDGARSKRADFVAKAFRVRDVFDFMWEMTWRPSTIARLSVPENWSPGRASVRLRDADDKARHGREVTLTARARAILERCAPKKGLIFGEHTYAEYLKAAAKKTLPKHKADDFARYDLRHGRISDLVEITGDILGTGWIAGHLQATTTNAYLRAKRRQGDAVIAAADMASAARDGGTLRARALKTNQKPTVFQSGREDSNLRPLDPQASSESQAHETIGEGGSTDHDKTRHIALGHDPMGARSGHAVLVDSARALILQEAIWGAFDRFSADADSESDKELS